MRKNRIYYPESISNQIPVNILLTTEMSHYVKNVLRLKVSDNIFLFNNTGFEYKSVINNIDKKSVSITILEKTEINLESQNNINLGQAISKNYKMDLVIQKTTELGVTKITPILTSRSMIKLSRSNSMDNKLDHFNKIAIAACCQCGRNVLPVINNPIGLSDWLEKLKSASEQDNIKEKNHTLNLILDPNSKLNISNFSEKYQLKSINNFNILIGPEGGLTEEEVELAKECKFIAINLGPRILRTETAAIAIISYLQFV